MKNTHGGKRKHAGAPKKRKADKKVPVCYKLMPSSIRWLKKQAPIKQGPMIDLLIQTEIEKEKE